MELLGQLQATTNKVIYYSGTSAPCLYFLGLTSIYISAVWKDYFSLIIFSVYT